jgi:hypothetical protein
VKKIHTYLSPMFTISLSIFVGSCLLVEVTGGVGPCGPASSWGVVWFIGYPIGFLGMVLGFVLSLVKTFRYLQQPKDKRP